MDWDWHSFIQQASHLDHVFWNSSLNVNFWERIFFAKTWMMQRMSQNRKIKLLIHLTWDKLKVNNSEWMFWKGLNWFGGKWSRKNKVFQRIKQQRNKRWSSLKMASSCFMRWILNLSKYSSICFNHIEVLSNWYTRVVKKRLCKKIGRTHNASAFD